MKEHIIEYENNKHKSRSKVWKSSYHKQTVVQKMNLNKKIERIELRMKSGEMVRHNKVNKKPLSSGMNWRIGLAGLVLAERR
jgi:hypothetical protein